ncbi:MAG: hypothetical protein GY908_09995 [Flavobacteriales bacterium]|nr:hypothetical protein [Flavobacteriales bacterium]
MKSRSVNRITTFDELNLAKLKLADTIKKQEQDILDSPVLSIVSTIFQGGSVRSSLKHSMESFSLENYKGAAMNLISTILMANKKTRKFFVAFIIAKEMVPFILDKVNEYVKK